MSNDFDKLMNRIQQNTVEHERARNTDVLNDKFKLEDATLNGIERQLIRYRSLSYMDGSTLIAAYRVVNSDLKKITEDKRMMESRVRALELRIDQYQASTIRSLIKQIIAKLASLNSWLDKKMNKPGSAAERIALKNASWLPKDIYSKPSDVHSTEVAKWTDPDVKQ